MVQGLRFGNKGLGFGDSGLWQPQPPKCIIKTKESLENDIVSKGLVCCFKPGKTGLRSPQPKMRALRLPHSSYSACSIELVFPSPLPTFADFL